MKKQDQKTGEDRKNTGFFRIPWKKNKTLRTSLRQGMG